MYIVRFKYTDATGKPRRGYFGLVRNPHGGMGSSVKLVSNREDAWQFKDPSNAADVCRILTTNQTKFEGRVIKC